MRIRKMAAALLLLGIGAIISGFYSLNIAAAPRSPEDNKASVSYQTHIQNVGWQNEVKDGSMSGTAGRSLRLEGIKINVSGPGDLGVEYSTHVQYQGWKASVNNGGMSGTEGKSLRLEAITISLTGEKAANYDIYYRVHCQDYGWLGWAKNGAYAGTSGQSKRLEAIEIKIVEVGVNAPGDTSRPFIAAAPKLSYQVYLGSWESPVADGQTADTKGGDMFTALNVICTNLSSPKALKIVALCNQPGLSSESYGTDIPYGPYDKAPYIPDYMSMFYIKLEEPGYSIYYRAYNSKFGWSEWCTDGEAARPGSKIEKLEMRLIKAGEAIPAD